MLKTNRKMATRVFIVICASAALIWSSHARILVTLAQDSLPSIVAANPDPNTVNDVAAINQQLQEKRQAISQLDEKTKTLETSLAARQKQSQTLERDLAILNDDIESNTISIQRTQLEVDQAALELDLLQHSINQKNSQAESKRTDLADLIRRWNRQENRTPLEAALVYHSFSDFLTQLKETEGLQSSLQDSYAQLMDLKRQLEDAQAEKTTKRDQLVQKQTQLKVQQEALGQQQSYKDSLLSESRSSENQYQAVLLNIRAEADQINAEITTLEQRVREKLGGAGEPLPAASGPITWPLDPGRGISAYFHDPSYPFRCTKQTGNNCIGEHSGVDIRAPQGTPVRAAADGYVAIAHNPDWVRDVNEKITRSAYNYVSILHGGNISTVYGHLSVVSVAEDQLVKQGQIIGLSGALPGTAGAGPWTTGAHLHFEVRQNGIPVDPLQYLPQ